MKTGPAVLLVVLAILFQALAGSLYRVGNVVPDFPFLALIYLAFFSPPRALLLLTAGTAVAIDLLSLDPLGTRLCGYVPALWLLNRMRRSFATESHGLRVALTLCAALLCFVLEGAYLAWREGRWLGTGVELEAAVYTGILGLVVHGILDHYRVGLGWARDRH